MNIEASSRLLLEKMNNMGAYDFPSAQKVGDSQAFDGAFQTAIQQFNQSQVAADQAVQSLVMGENVAMHDVMIQTTEAQLSLELAVQVRNKCLEAYNEIKNMQF